MHAYGSTIWSCAQASEATSESLAVVQEERDNAYTRVESLEIALEEAKQEAGDNASAGSATATAAAAAAADAQAAAERAMRERETELEEVRREAASALEQEQVLALFGGHSCGV